VPRRLRAIALGTNRRAIVSSCLIIALVICSCSESKISQCQKLLKVTNLVEPLNREFEAQFKKIDANSRPKDLKEVQSKLRKTSDLFQNTANQFIKISQYLRAIDLEDPQLQNWKNQYINLVEKYQLNLSNLANLLPSVIQVNTVNEFSLKFQVLEKDGEQSFAQLTKLDREQQKLERDINAYCQN
jgi:hypothetical protein